MHKPNIFALFCEDIREEKNEQVSLIGILPDTVNVAIPRGHKVGPAARPMMPKMGVYLRFNFDADSDLPEYEARLVLPDNHTLSFGKLDRAIIEQAKADAKSRGLPLAGLVIKAVYMNVALNKPGLVRAEVQNGDNVEVVGGVTFSFPDDETTSPTASPPLS